MRREETMEKHTTTFGRVNNYVASLIAPLAVCVLVALAMAIVAVPQQAPAQEAPAHNSQAQDIRTYRGTNGVGMVLKEFDGSTQPREVEESYRTAKEMGVEWTRVIVPWFHIERKKGHYDWQALDRTIEMAEKYNIKVMMQVTSAPIWATSLEGKSHHQLRSLGHHLDSYAPKPQNYNDYARFFADVVKRYSSRGIVDYEVWNEPSIDLYWRESNGYQVPSPEAYTQLLKKTYPAAHRANPNVNVIAGGQVITRTEHDGSRINALDYLKRMYAAGAQGYFDSLAHHPYGIHEPDWLWNGWAYMFNDKELWGAPADSLHSVMQAHGDGHKEIWITETGKDTKRGSVDEHQQARSYEMYFEEWQNTPNLGPMIFYELKDRRPYGTTDIENYFGVLRHDGSWKPAATAMKNYTQTFGNRGSRPNTKRESAPAPLAARQEAAKATAPDPAPAPEMSAAQPQAAPAAAPGIQFGGTPLNFAIDQWVASFVGFGNVWSRLARIFG